MRALKDQHEAESLVLKIIAAISEHHEVRPAEILLLKPGRVLKTSSGKIQRSANKQAWQSGDFAPLHCWKQQRAMQQRDLTSTIPATQEFHDRADIEKWLLAELSQRSGLVAHEIDLNRSFSSYGLDSLAAIQLVGDLNAKRSESEQIDPTELWNYSTVASLLDYLYPQASGSDNTVENKPAEKVKADTADEEGDLASEVAALRALLGD